MSGLRVRCAASVSYSNYADDLQWLTAYLAQHMLSHSSWVYAWILSRGGYLGALWSKWALRRRTWRKKRGLAAAQRKGQPHRQPQALPSNAQILTITVLFLSALALSFAGPDNLAPGAQLWNLSKYPSPQFTINKAWWTSGDRTGLISFALFPLVLALLHRWCGFLSWILATLHTVFWATQLALDHRARTGVIGFDYAWKFQRFQYAWAAYASFTLLMLCSIPALRRHHYETFYFTHIIFFPVMLICSALHHPPVAWWCWGALSLWIAERCYRFTWWLILMDSSAESRHLLSLHLPPRAQIFLTSPHLPHKPRYSPDARTWPALMRSADSPTLPRIDPTLKAPRHQLLPGRTVRIRLVTPLFLLGILASISDQHPDISRLTSHPFTCASVCDSLAEHDSGREIKGWTKRLWDTVAGCVMPQRGVLMRGYVDGPFGSAARARWGEHSSVVLFAGGSGVSFALSVLEYGWKELGGRRGGFGTKGFNISRVRFVWIVSQFSHVHWCAHALRKCMAMVSSSELQIDIFVTTGKAPLMKSVKPPPVSINPLAMKTEDPLIPPTPMFVLEEQETRRSSLDKQQDVPEDITGTPRTSFESDGSADEDIDLSYYTSEDMGDRNGELGHEEHILDLTNFEDDDDTALPGEAALNEAVRKEGSARRQLRPMSEASVIGDDGSGRNTRLSLSNFQPIPIHQLLQVPLPHPPAPPLSFLTRPDSIFSQWSDAHSLAALVSEAAAQEHIRLELEDEELTDISVVAERARAGRPAIQKILADEVQRASGSVIVGCCGPTSLNAVVRKNVAALIDPEKGMIDLIAEDFGY
ncbi:hypothetical protein BC629DRAFT_1579267 [Irpex lacteus]|nr:hypothetical protein BC629DRAFT_1579267 [Irpex lacteus]